MSNSSFVWFDNRSHQSRETIQFYEELLNWKSGAGPKGMTMLLGESGPWAGISEASEAVSGWIPYVEVEDLDPSIAKARKLGATVLQARSKGPAGDYAILNDPGGAKFALWKRS